MKFPSNLGMTILASSLVLFTGLLAGCGGHSRTIVDDDDTVSPAGASGTGAAQAGAPASGGSLGSPAGSGNQCNNVNCAVPDCSAGYKLVSPLGSCCPVCLPVCTPDQGCPAIGCGSGSHSETPEGACCPVCVTDPEPTCDDGKAAYAQTREQFLEKYRMGCMSDSDCVVLAPVNACENGCQYSTVWTRAANFFTDNLESLAEMQCSSCEKGPIPPCSPPEPPHCLMGECQFASLK